MLVKFAAVLLLCTALAVVADWYGVFGQREEHVQDVVHVTFKFVDDRTGAPIPDVHITCVRRMSESACTERAGKNPGETTITLGVLRIVNRTLLFGHDAGFSLGGTGPVPVAFVHPNYERLFQQLEAGDISDRHNDTRVVRLTKTAD